MIGLVQRVSRAHVSVQEHVVGKISSGMVVMVGIEKNDTQSQAQALLERILSFRIFNDEAQKMNWSLSQTKGGLLLIPQFTLAAETSKGTRPGFSTSAPPAVAKPLFDYLCEKAKALHPTVATGVFGATMQVSLINEGPATFWLETKPV